MNRYEPPDPICQHVATVRISSHVDLAAAAATTEPIASTHCCDRQACQDDAKAWLRAVTRRDTVHVIPILRRTHR